jgi:hypothetical protein
LDVFERESKHDYFTILSLCLTPAAKYGIC